MNTELKIKTKRYVNIAVTRESDIMLEVASTYARVYKSEIIARLARCPACGVLLLHEGPGLAKCPACGAVYRLELL